MKDLLDKLSSYNIFNYLFPGILFAALGVRISSYPLLMDNIFLGIFVYYFYGIVISRIGSLFIEPFLKCIRVIKYLSYDKFIDALKVDNKIELLSEINNMYRTLLSVFICLLVLIGYDHIEKYYQISTESTSILFIVFFILLFILSYRKQSNYVRSRIEHSIKLGTEKKEVNK